MAQLSSEGVGIEGLLKERGTRLGDAVSLDLVVGGARYVEDRDGGSVLEEPGGEPLYLADPAEDVSGSRPMSIEWTLRAPLPAELFGAFSVLRG